MGTNVINTTLLALCYFYVFRLSMGVRLILFTATYFVDLAVKMYQFYYLKMTL
jgi:hypothetical protein